MRLFISLIQNFPILTFIVMLTVLLNLRNRRTKAISEQQRDSFWEKESKANSTRKKDLSNLNYITIPEKSLPFIETNDEIINTCQQNLQKLMSEQIVNLTGYTNTELKLQYGAANLNLLTQFDTNFTRLCRILNTWGARLFELNMISDACTVLEFAVSVMSDVSNTYKLLGQIYVQSGTLEKIDFLIAQAKQLNSLSKPVIIKALSELKDSSIS